MQLLGNEIQFYVLKQICYIRFGSVGQNASKELFSSLTAPVWSLSEPSPGNFSFNLKKEKEVLTFNQLNSLVHNYAAP